jgi:hypothetical protein
MILEDQGEAWAPLAATARKVTLDPRLLLAVFIILAVLLVILAVLVGLLILL